MCLCVQKLPFEGAPVGSLCTELLSAETLDSSCCPSSSPVPACIQEQLLCEEHRHRQGQFTSIRAHLLFRIVCTVTGPPPVIRTYREVRGGNTYSFAPKRSENASIL